MRDMMAQPKEAEQSRTAPPPKALRAPDASPASPSSAAEAASAEAAAAEAAAAGSARPR